MQTTTMESAQPQITQKEYLKKYLSKDGRVKKKKKKLKVISSSSHLKRSVIIDDDLGLPSMASIEDEEFNLEYLGDEAPQIAGVIDERPLEVRAKESYGDEKKWKPINETEDVIKNLVSKTSQALKTADLSDKSKPFDENGYNSDSIGNSKKQGIEKKGINHGSESDLSPPRNKNSLSKRDSDSDLSPERPSTKKDNKNRMKENKENYSNFTKENIKTKQDKHSSDSDLSPPRNKKKHISEDDDSDLSPSRIKYKSSNRKRDSNNSGAPKYQRHDRSSTRRDKYEEETRPKHRSRSSMSPRGGSSRYKHVSDSDSDLSPVRKSTKDTKYKEFYNSRKNDKYPNKRHNYESSKGYVNKKQRSKSSDSDLSPPRKSERDKSNKNRNNSSPKLYDRKFAGKEKGRERRKSSDSDLSPPRKPSDRDARRGNENKGDKNKKLDKTLDGKKAGLQNAKHLKEELRKLKEAEEAVFSKMKASVSGQSAVAIVRDRKTGKIKDMEKEKEKIIEKSAKSLELERKYEKWGKGTKQVEEAEDRLADTLHEMNKPLARYAGDHDLERMLKAREREGDPMLEYIKSKQTESISLDNIGKPKYQGHFMPNRFGIRPGHRWDGVDRSSGYEKQWFERQNAKKAIQEEAYKWSTSDM